MIFYSIKTRDVLARPHTSDYLGRSHYTYSIVAARILRIIAGLGISAVEIDRPEMYELSRLPGNWTSTRRPVHLIFKPCEEIRPLRGAYNIGMIYWEFDRILTTSVKAHRPPISTGC